MVAEEVGIGIIVAALLGLVVSLLWPDRDFDEDDDTDCDCEDCN